MPNLVLVRVEQKYPFHFLIKLTILLGLRKALDKSYRENQDRHFCPVYFFYFRKDDFNKYGRTWEMFYDLNKHGFTSLRFVCRVMRQKCRHTHTHSQFDVLSDAREARDNETKSLSLRYILSHCAVRVDFCIKVVGRIKTGIFVQCIFFYFRKDNFNL
jgi:hypothetical protein